MPHDDSERFEEVNYLRTGVKGFSAQWRDGETDGLERV